MFSPSSRGRLTDRDLGRFPGGTLFDRLARAVCHAGCLPRKELYEAWEVARRVRRHFRGGRIVDLGGGHGLLAQTLLILDDSSPCAIVADRTLPPSAAKLHEVLVPAWPRLAGRVEFVAKGLDEVDVHGADLVVSCHACGSLNDVVLDRAVSARSRVVVLPCCHHLKTGDTAGLSGWVDRAAAIDIVRAVRLGQCGYLIWTQTVGHSSLVVFRASPGGPGRFALRYKGRDSPKNAHRGEDENSPVVARRVRKPRQRK